MSLIAIPSAPAAPETLEIVLVDSTSLVRSPFTGKTQVFNWGGSWLEGSFSLPQLINSEAQLWFYFLQQLKGQENTFQFTSAFVAAYPWLLQGGSPITTISWRLKSNTRKMSLTHQRTFGLQVDIIEDVT